VRITRSSPAPPSKRPTSTDARLTVTGHFTPLSLGTDAVIRTLDHNPQIISSDARAHCPTGALWTTQMLLSEQHSCLDLHLASVNAHTGSSLITHLVYCCTLSHVFCNTLSDFTSCSTASSPAPQYLYLIMTTSTNNDEDCTELPSTLQLQFHQRTCSWKECLKTDEVRS
jgi:hypothetical protein